MNAPAIALCTVMLMALIIGPVRAQGVEETLQGLSPKLEWIRTERFRGGYNYCADPEWFPEAEAAGLNAVISRLEIANDPSGDEEIDDEYPEGRTPPSTLRCWRLVRPTSRAAKHSGLHFLYMCDYAQDWANINDGLRDNPRRCNNGERPSPVDDVYWTRVIEQRFVRVAQMLQGEQYQIDGFLIDSETYGFGGGSPGGVDYGDFALGRFVQQTGADLQFEGLSIPERRELIADRGLEQKLRDFQVERIREMAQRTRERVQALVPDAILGFFLWKNQPWYRGVAAGFSTPEVPCWVGPESTYPGAFDEQFLRYAEEVRAQARVPILFCPGLRYGYENGQVPRTFLEVLPGNLYHRAINTAGYWFWALHRMGATPQDRRPFLEALRTVNTELDRYAAAGGDYESPLQPAPLPVERPAHLQQLLTEAPQWQPLPAEAIPDDPPEPTGLVLRGMHTFVARAEPGETLAIDVRNLRLGRYTAGSAVSFFRPDGSRAAQAHIDLGQQARVEHEADAAGPWVMAVTAHNNAWWAMPQSATAALFAPDRIHLCDHDKGPSASSRLFFYVPRATQQFTLVMGASEAEPATFRLFRPDGETLCEHVRIVEQVEQSVEPEGLGGRVWWVEATDAAEDHWMRLEGIPNIVAAEPEQLLVPAL